MRLLSSLLFEDSEQLDLLSPQDLKAPESAFKHVPPTKNLFSPPEFALFGWNNNNALGLVYTPMFRAWIKMALQPDKYSYYTIRDTYTWWLCGYIEGQREPSHNKCLGAVPVAYVARNPKFPGAGGAMYALLSNLKQAPVTSDRLGSSSSSAKKMWNKIANSPEWTATPLDNYIDNDQWVRVDGEWPERTITIEDEPATPDDTSDDCELPWGYPAAINKKLGSPYACEYHGPLDAAALLESGRAFVEKLRSENMRLVKTGEIPGLITYNQVRDWVSEFADRLFANEYKGIEG